MQNRDAHPAVTDRPLISVVMPVYNSARYLGEAIQSILAQQGVQIEFIIVDDGSNDGSVSIIREFAEQDARIRPVLLEHGGAQRAANTGVALAHGEWIARMDSDDIALPQRLAIQLEWMQAQHLDVCGTQAMRFGAATGAMWFPESAQAIRHELLFRVGMLHPTLVVRADVLKRERYDENVYADDYELLTRLAPRYALGNVPQFLLKRRAHPQQMHITGLSAYGRGLQEFRQRYFGALFPEATVTARDRYTRIAERKPFSDLGELERAGEWLAELAQLPDQMLRQRMALRWRDACCASAALGAEGEKIYRRGLLKFGLDDAQSDFFNVALGNAVPNRAKEVEHHA